MRKAKVRPRVDVRTVAAPPLWKVSALLGLWYATEMKAGALGGLD